MLFLICGLAICLFTVFMTIEIEIIYRIIITIVFLFVMLLLRKSKDLEKYYPVFFAFFVASLVNLLQRSFIPFAGGTIESIVFNNLVSMMLIIIPIILLIRITGNELGSIYLKKGNIKKGLIIGVVTFLSFLVTAIPASIFIFGGQEVSLGHLISLAPWILIFIFSNGLREELWLRGLFLKKYESFLGADRSNLLQAIIFSLAHTYVPFDPFLLIYWALTFFLGLAYGAVMQKTDSVLAPILFHAGADIPVILAVFSYLI